MDLLEKTSTSVLRTGLSQMPPGRRDVGLVGVGSNPVRLGQSSKESLSGLLSDPFADLLLLLVILGIDFNLSLIFYHLKVNRNIAIQILPYLARKGPVSL